MENLLDYNLKELEKIVTHVVPLKESDKVFDMIEDPECGTIKIVVDCENV